MLHENRQRIDKRQASVNTRRVRHRLINEHTRNIVHRMFETRKLEKNPKEGDA